MAQGFSPACSAEYAQEAARNMNVAVRETENGIVFLHRLEAGGTDRSYGIHVAELAGLPQPVLSRARSVLGTLETEHRVLDGHPPRDPDPTQPSLFDLLQDGVTSSGEHPVPAALRAGNDAASAAANAATPLDATIARQLRGLDIDAMTPLEALLELARLKREAT